MMKYFLFLIVLLTITFCSLAQKTEKVMKDGLYLITTIDTLETHKTSPKSNEKEVRFSTLFEEYNSGEYIRLIVDTTQYVPLELQSAPSAEQQTEHKKKLLLTLTKRASEQLITFSTQYVNKRVALIVDGEALTMHKIRVPITSGQLQITLCLISVLP